MATYMKRAEELRFELSLNGRTLTALDDLELEISAAIRGDGVADNASNALMDARRRIERCTAQLRERLSSMPRTHPEYYADGYVAERRGRQTLPVKSQYIRSVPGTIIDRSQTGATVFIEPGAAEKLRLELERAMVDEENEVRRVLYALTAMVDDLSDAILQNARLMERLDMDGALPSFHEERRICIEKVRHPLLDRDKAVPLDVEISQPASGIVITGSNTGGKTVALKTIGLFSLMAQSGLMVPAKAAALCPTDHVLADVGDGQSISENLSTFSAHITSVMDILKAVTPNSIVLMDELDSGTDPAEGMGLAVAVLEELIKAGCLFFVTTHYPEIKEFARTSEAILNARIRFDPASLRPLYSLEIGEAGESCALLIAKRLGMPDDIINRARRAVNGNIACEAKPREGGRARFERYEAPSIVSKRAALFGCGDSVRVYPAGETGIVVEGADDIGRILVQTRSGKRLIPHKRLKLLVKAEEFYPEDYDFSIIFDSVANRKARHKMGKRHDPSLIVVEAKIDKG